MVKVEGQAISYSREDEHILRRLGGAVAVQWGSLPEAVQELILKQAIHMSDRAETHEVEEQIKAFIAAHQSATASARG